MGRYSRLNFRWRGLLLILCLITSSASSQDLSTYNGQADISEILNANPSQRVGLFGKSYGTKGTPYVYEEFRKGDIYFANKSFLKDQMINYDCYNDWVVLNRGENDYLLSNRTIDYLVFYQGDSLVLFKQVFLSDKKETAFLQVLYQGHCTLYKHYYKSFTEADYTTPYSSDRRYDEYIDEHAWYLMKSNRDISRLHPRKRSIQKLLEPHSQEIQQYIKKEKPDLKSDKDLIKLIKYYDGLDGNE